MKCLLANKNFYQWKIKWYLNEDPLELSKGSGLLSTSKLEKNDLDYYGQLPTISWTGVSSSVKVKQIHLKYIGKASEFYPVSLDHQWSNLPAFNLYIDDLQKNKQPLIMIESCDLKDFIPQQNCAVS